VECDRRNRVTPVPRRSLVVLLVEDDDELSAILAGHLEDAGYRAFVAANGAEALAVLEAIPAPGLIILDLEMPVLDGWDLLAALRRRPALDASTVIVTSSAAPSVIARRRTELGRVCFFRKPVDYDALFDAIESCGREDEPLARTGS